MIKALILLSALAVVCGQEFEFIDNMVDFDNTPYQHISLPYYPHHNDREMRVINIQSKPNNDLKEIKKYEVVELPAKLKEPKEAKEIKTSLTITNSSVTSTLCTVASKIIGLAKAGLNLLAVNGPALALGAMLMVAFCKITSVCTKISSIKSLSQAQKEFNAFVTPERLDMATELIQEAIRRYRSIQANYE